MYNSESKKRSRNELYTYPILDINIQKCKSRQQLQVGSPKALLFIFTSGVFPTGASLSISKWRLREISVYYLKHCVCLKGVLAQMDKREICLRIALRYMRS